MKKQRFKTQYNPGVYPGQKFTQKSTTIPNQAFTVDQMLKRYNQGQQIPIDNRLIWEEWDGVDPYPTATDLTDLQKAKMFVKDIQAKIREAEKKEKDPPTTTETPGEKDSPGEEETKKD